MRHSSLLHILRDATLEVLDEQLVPLKKLSEHAGKFFELLRPCKTGKVNHLTSLGSSFQKSVAEMEEYLKIAIATQSGMGIISRGNSSKAAEFEEKLRPRNVTLADLPKSVRCQIDGLAKRG